MIFSNKKYEYYLWKGKIKCYPLSYSREEALGIMEKKNGSVGKLVQDFDLEI